MRMNADLIDVPVAERNIIQFEKMNEECRN